MQVLTLDQSALDIHAKRLAELVESNSSVVFDALVGVRRGGSLVCDAFCRHFPKNRYRSRYDIALQRPSTKHKGKLISKILQLLPIPVLNLMRIAEAKMLSFHRKVQASSAAVSIEMPEELKKMLNETAQAKILIIDDAVDSGYTLSAIANTLMKTAPEAEIKTAVITETTDQPRIRADFSLYHNRTLIRFPWSNDYKKNSKE